MLDNNDIFLMKSGLERNEVPDGYVIYNVQTSKVVFLNPTAAIILELCDGSRDVGSIVEDLQGLFELKTAPQENVETCISMFLAEGLVEPCAPS